MTFLLISDLDHTWVGDAVALDTLHRQLDTHRHRVCLIYATGRSRASALDLQSEVGLMEPDYWITAVGSEIYSPQGLDQAWSEHLSRDWHRETVAVIAEEFQDLIPQSEREQNPWKISFCLAPEGSPSVIEQLQAKLRQAGVMAQLIFSSGRDLDLLPVASNKGNASRYLAQRLGFAPEQTLVCGDSGNDISLFETEARGVIVNNAQPELLAWYHAQGQPYHYHAQSGYAAGILEAIAYFGFLED